MTKSERSEGFKKRVYNFVLRVLRFTSTLQKNDTTRVLIDQLIRAATSILGNYVEAGASSSRKDYTNFFNHALKSANETKIWLALLRDTNNGNKEEIGWLLEEVAAIANILASSIITLRGKRSI